MGYLGIIKGNWYFFGGGDRDFKRFYWNVFKPFFQIVEIICQFYLSKLLVGRTLLYICVGEVHSNQGCFNKLWMLN